MEKTILENAMEFGKTFKELWEKNSIQIFACRS